ncbi:MAG: amidohydrolase [Candidatus Rokubacteria bacterium]|nr:amidohydrolase [Candidatus Rokubacteria bacterium]
MVIDVHAHLYPRPFMEAVAAHGPPYGVSLSGAAPPFLCFEGINFWRYTDAFHDVDARLRQLDAAGVERQVISLGPPMTYWAPPKLALALCRTFNDEIAAVVRRHPDRFLGLAALPLQDAALALGELDRAVNDLGFVGAGIGSNVHGTQLDDPRIRPFFETADARALPIFIHPINPAGHADIHDYRLDLAVGFPYDTTIAAARLVYGGIMERCPRMRVCLAHLGGVLPFLRERLAMGFRVGKEHFGAAFSATESAETSIERFWFDTISYHEPALLAGVACVGAERLVIGSDAPFAVGDLARSVREIRAFPFLPERDREKILGENALRFLGLDK